MSLRRDPAKSNLSMEEEHELQGLISDAMGFCREGNYEQTEALLSAALGYVVNDNVRRASILRKMSILYEQQDRVDESHSCWETAKRLENEKSFGRSERLMEFLKPDYDNNNNNNNKTIGEQLMEQKEQQESAVKDQPAMSKEDIKALIAKTIRKNSHPGYKEQVVANERFITSVVSMCKEETKDFNEQNELKKNKQALAVALKNIKPGEIVNNNDYDILWHENRDMKSLAGGRKRRRRRRRVVGRRKEKKQSVEDLKKIIRSPKTQDIAGQAALTLAIRYVKQKQPKMAYKFYRKSIQKERIENKELLEESLELKVASKRWRGLKERREGEEAIVENHAGVDDSDRIILNSLRGVWELLIKSPIAAFDVRKVQLATTTQVESARLWSPNPPVDENTPKYIFCAAPICAHFSRLWLAQFPQLEKELTERRSWRSGAAEQRRKSLKYFISKMYGVVFGPCGDLLAEVFEEVLETREDGLDIVLLKAAANFYVRRRHFRRSQELFARALAIERGETRMRDVKLRSWGEPSLHSVLHIDNSLAKYVEKLPELILKATEHETMKLLDEAPDTGRSGTTELKRSKTEKFGTFGEFGDPLSDTWDNALASPGISDSVYKLNKRDDRLVIPTTIGRERDGDPFLQAVGVSGREVSATGGVQILTKLHAVDIKRGGMKQKIPDDMSEKRRMDGQKLLWRSFTGHKPTVKSTPQGRIEKKDGIRSKWYGEPKRTWMKSYQNEASEKVPDYMTKKMPEDIPPPVIEKQLEEIYGGGGIGTRPTTTNTTTTEKIITSTLNVFDTDVENKNYDALNDKNDNQSSNIGNGNTVFDQRNNPNVNDGHRSRSPSTRFSNRQSGNNRDQPTPSTRGSEYLNKTNRLEQLRESARRQVRQMVHAERQAISRSTAHSSRARSPSPTKPGGMASWWLDEDGGLELEMPLHHPNSRPGTDVSGMIPVASIASRGNTASTLGGSSKHTLASRGRDIYSSHSTQHNNMPVTPSGIPNNVPVRTRTMSRENVLRTPYDQRPKDSLDMLFDSRPSTRQTDIESRGGSATQGTRRLAVSKSQPNIPVMSVTIGMDSQDDSQVTDSVNNSPNKMAYLLDNSISKNIVDTSTKVNTNQNKHDAQRKVATSQSNMQATDSSGAKQLSRKEVLKTMGVLRSVGM